MTAKKITPSMNNWARAFREHGDTALAEIFHESEESKITAQKNLKQLKLPILKYVSAALPAFLENPDYFFKQIPSKLLYINLLSNKKNQTRAFGITPTDALAFVKDSISTKDVRSCTIFVSEFYKNEYGGNIVIGKNGSVFLEMVEGLNDDITLGIKTPHIFAEQHHRFEPLIYYTRAHGKRHQLHSSLLKHGITLTLSKIPKHHKTARRFGYRHPGYYEFVLVHKDSKHYLSPIFLDYRDARHYTSIT